MINTSFNFYGFFIILSLIIPLIFISIDLYKKNVKLEEILFLIFLELLCILFFGKLINYLMNYKTTKSNLLTIGLSSYGGVTGLVISLLLFCKMFHYSFIHYLKKHIIYVPLMYSISKLGCFFVGCCYGIKYSGIGSIIYNYSSMAPKGVSLFPIQFVETLVFLIIFTFIFKNRNKSNIISYTFIICGLSKFLLDYLRYSHINEIISINQIISIIFVLLGIIVLYKNKKLSN